MEHEIVLPQIGSDITEVTVTRVLVEGGSMLKPDDIYMSVSTDKVDIDLQIEYPAIVLTVPVEVGDKVSEGGLLLVVEALEADPERPDLYDQNSNVMIGLRYLAARDAPFVCCRDELQGNDFSEYETFVDRTTSIARSFLDEIDLLGLDEKIIQELRETLFSLTRLVSEMDGFRPSKWAVAAFDRHLDIKSQVARKSGAALQRFRRLYLLVTGVLGTRPKSLRSPFYIFISYARKNRRFAKQLEKRLAERGIDSFLDERIAPGSEILSYVHDRLRSSAMVIVIYSNASCRSQWVAYEIGFARGCGVDVVPYVIDEDLELPGFIASHQHLTQAEETGFLDSLTQRGI